MKSKELREKRAKLAAEIQKLANTINDEKREFTAEEQTNWDAVNRDHDVLTRQIEIAERAELVGAEDERTMRQRTTVPDVRHDADEDERDDEDEQRTTAQPQRADDAAVAMQAWFRSQLNLPLSDVQRAACRRSGINPNRSQFRVSLDPNTRLRAIQNIYRTSHPSMVEQRALTAGVGADGGYTIPTGFVNNLEMALLQYGPMLQVAEILRTDSGGDLPWPMENDTGNTGAQVGENTSAGSESKPTGAQTVLKAYKFTSTPIYVTEELLEDSAFDMAGVVGSMLGERIGRILNTKFTTGTGAATPRGIVTASSTSVTAASATAIKADEVIDLVHSVDPAYRIGAAFMLHDSILAYLRKLKDGNGQYLWQPGMSAGVPDRLYGYPVFINQDMDSTVAATKKTILFGQLNKYKVRQVRDIRMYRLQELGRLSDYDTFVAFIRADGNLIDAGTHPVKYLLQS